MYVILTGLIAFVAFSAGYLLGKIVNEPSDIMKATYKCEQLRGYDG